MKQRQLTRLISVLLVLCMVLGYAVPTSAIHAHEAHGTQTREETLSFQQVDNSDIQTQPIHEAVEAESQQKFADTDMVRVSILLEGASVIEAGFSTLEIADNLQAMTYRQELAATQEKITAKVQTAVGSELDVQWNLTLAANLISANVLYGDIETIRNVAGVRDVILENRYDPAVVQREETADPNMATSGEQIGSLVAWANGYTGAGSRIAVIDTGADTDHQSFDADAYLYALEALADQKGMETDAYIQSLDLLDAEEIESVLDKLNLQGTEAESLYVNAKIPFGYNYIDGDYDITHDNDNQGSHGSHVAGIATANTWIAQDDGSYAKALNTALVQGVAPEAQLIVMKVFGKQGGAYESDYMAAIEDAIILGADVVNLSLGTGNPGFSFNETYQELLDSLEDTDTVVVTSASNNAAWATYDYNLGYLYGDEVSFNTAGSPGSHHNTLAVASVDNAGTTGYYFQFGDELVFYNEYLELWGVQSILTLAGEQEYIFLDGIGSEEDFAAVADVLPGKIAFCSRGTNSFYEKANAAAANGAIATVIYNNQPGIITMNLAGYTYFAPAVSITQYDADRVRAMSTPVTDEAGNVLYYTGKLTIGTEIASGMWNQDYETISSFSSWGVPGSLILKPEITAPGGSIYSVSGWDQSGTAYETMSGTSMASPQVAGMVALMAQYIREKDLDSKTDLSVRGLAQSLLMSTATPMLEMESNNYYSVMRQGAGLANVGHAVSANSYIQMDEAATYGYADGKIKAELGDDPERTGSYSFGFTLNDLTGQGGLYTLSSDFFTQDMFQSNGQTYLDTLTASLSAHVTYTVDGRTFVPTVACDCDLDGDGDTDADDAQIIVNYKAGLQTELDPKADLDGDGSITSYDARVLLTSLETAAFSVPQGGSVDIVVNVELTDSIKAYLDTYYTVGAYVEGFVFVNPLANEEGAMMDVTHSIPVLGFYGNWSDSSMYESSGYLDAMYGTGRPSHTGEYQNNLIVKYSGSAATYYLTGNPYFQDETFNPERLALNSRDTLHQYAVSLIRNAAALGILLTDENGEVIYNCGAASNLSSAYYYTNWGVWYDTWYNVDIAKKMSTIGVKEGDKVTITVVSVPEYYLTGEPLGSQALEQMVRDGVLGEGAFLRTTVLVDNTAPQVNFISKDLDNGNLIVSSQDNNYLSAILVYGEEGTELLTMVNPNQKEAGQTMTTVVDLTGITIRERCTVVVADSANNKSTYLVEYGGAPEDFTGRMYAFNNDGNRGEANVWMEIDPQKVYWANKNFNGGTTNLTRMDFKVRAAEYAGGYVFMADDQGNIYVAEHNKWDSYIKVGSTGLTGSAKAIYDMAFNYNDNQLYALGEGNVIYTINISTGKATKQYTVKIQNPEDSDYTDLRSLAIDGNGTFYAVNVAEEDEECVFLYKWDKSKVVNGTITKLEPVDEDRPLDRYNEYDSYQSLAWDHTTDTLYFANGDYKATNDNELLILNPDTGKATKANTNKNYLNSINYDAKMYDRVTALYIVPAPEEAVPPAENATGLEISKSSVDLYRGQTTQLRAYLYPWNLGDQSVTWSTGDASIAVVDENGIVRGTGEGSTVITATSSATPSLSASCTVSVQEMDKMELKALIHGADGMAYWSEFDSSATDRWTAASEATNHYLAGGLMEGKLIVHDGKAMYEVDPESFETQYLGGINASWIWSDATEMPGKDYLMGRTMLAGICSDGQILEMVDPYAGSLSYFDFSQFFETDPMSTIVYWGEGNQSGTDTQIFRIMTESGNLYQIEIWAGAMFIQANVDWLGDTGLDLTGTASVTSGQNASMIMDQHSGWYLLTVTRENGTSNLYAVDPVTFDVVDLGDFGQNVSPVVSLYQFNRITDLTVLLNTYEASVYAKEQIQLTADVKPWDANKSVVWASSDSSVATVDQNGLVTAVSAGTVYITATSTDVDDNGAPAVATCELRVLPLMPVNLDVHAQVETADGQYQWIGFNTSKLDEITVEAVTDLKVTAGTGHQGKIYGDTADGLVVIDPDNNYSITDPVLYSEEEVFLDMTAAPYLYYEGAYVPGIGATPALSFGQPAFVGENQVFGIFTDYETAVTWNTPYYASNTNNCLAAVCYVGQTTLNTAPAHAFVAMGTDGNVYKFACSPTSWDSEGVATSYAGSCNLIGNIGITFTDRSKLTMTYVNTETQQGYLIADSADGSTALYFVNIANDTMKTDMVGRVPGAVDLTALYSTTDMNMTGDTLQADPGFATWDGSAFRASSLVHISQPRQTVTEGQKTTVEELTDSAFEKLPVTFAQETGVTAGDGTVSVTISEDVETGNGLYRISYDPSVLTYTNVASAADLTAVHVDSINGIVTFAFASKSSMAAETAVATVSFAYENQYVKTSFEVSTLERNQELPETEVTLHVEQEDGGHSYQPIEKQDPTCLEEGYEILSCTKCGDTYRQELPALGHSYEGEVTAPTCTKAGYVTNVCSACGHSYIAEIIEATGHDFINGECTRCDAVAKQTFKDVPPGSFCFDAVEWAAENDITHGETATTFNPNGTCLRSHVVTFLWRAAGEPEPASANTPFVDVKESDFFYKAVLWAVEEGITNGTSDNEFSPFKECSRAEVVTFLWRAAGSPEPVSTNNPFVDVKTTDFFCKPVLWAAENSITNGVDATHFGPTMDCNRAQVVTFLYRAYNN